MAVAAIVVGHPAAFNANVAAAVPRSRNAAPRNRRRSSVRARRKIPVSASWNMRRNSASSLAAWMHFPTTSASTDRISSTSSHAMAVRSRQSRFAASRIPLALAWPSLWSHGDCDLHLHVKLWPKRHGQVPSSPTPTELKAVRKNLEIHRGARETPSKRLGFAHHLSLKWYSSTSCVTSAKRVSARHTWPSHEVLLFVDLFAGLGGFHLARFGVSVTSVFASKST